MQGGKDETQSVAWFLSLEWKKDACFFMENKPILKMKKKILTWGFYIRDSE